MTGMAKTVTYRILTLLLFSFICFEVAVTDRLVDAIPNEDVRNLTLDFMELCPLTELCKVNIFDYNNVTRFFFPCCKFCSCGEECQKSDTCCPDALDHLHNGERILRKCLKLRYTGTLNENLDDKMVIAACPSKYGDNDVVTKCNLGYQDYDIEDGYTGLVPVTDMSSGETYKNLACLDCNNGSMSDALYWSVVIGCTFSDTSLMLTLRYLHGYDDRNCNFFFKAPDALPTADIPQGCNPVITECNVTGNMEHVDLKLEQYCHSYTSQYKNYKNIHCALCNGVDRNNITVQCEPPTEAFHFLHEFVLDVPGIVASEKDMAKLEPYSTFWNCTPDSENTFLSNTDDIPCISRHCPKLEYLIGSECRPMYKSLPSYNVQMRLRFYPKGHAILSHDFVQSLKDTTHDILKQFRLENELNQIFMTTAFDMFVKIDERHYFGSDNSVRKATELSPGVIYAELVIQIRAMYIPNVTRFNEDCLDILQADFGERNLFQKEFISEKTGLLRHDISERHNLAILLDDDQRERFDVTEATIATDNKLILHFIKQTNRFDFGPFKSAYLTPLIFCSQVVLDSSKFQRSIAKDGIINVIVLGEKVELSKAVFEDTYEHAVMCEKDYEALVEKTTLPTIEGNRNETSIAARSVFNGEIMFLSYIFIMWNSLFFPV